ncbi:MAG: sugar ABC transporter permease [Atribacterota bacterium]|nr:sugar ABC transporter permease [Atribacterota bacterium]MDD4289044.1 sugar ABC transporter permease [Atribacterota bacterium]MDD4764750.1 sugar ABC transporter permease [Atribacterota bacterium]MDI9596163.1 sugar ABC transporter permease [Atribacterota bacterium]
MNTKGSKEDKNIKLLPQTNTFTWQLQNNMTIILFLLPAFILLSMFLVYPIFRSAYYSLFNWKGFGPAVDYIGIENYTRLLTDKIFLKAVKNGILIVIFSLVIQLPIAMGLALIVGRDIPGKAFFRAIFFMPYILSEVITAIMWLILYNPNPRRGFLNAIINIIPSLEPQAWLADTRLVLPAIFVVLTWKYVGFHMLLYITGLQNIPRDIEEAALIDGVNSRQMVTHITLPLLAGTIKTSIYLSIIGSLQVYALVWIMTRGGPVNASEVMSTYMYRYSFVRFELGYGSAVAIIMLLISLTFSIIYLRLTRNTENVS